MRNLIKITLSFSWNALKKCCNFFIKLLNNIRYQRKHSLNWKILKSLPKAEHLLAIATILTEWEERINNAKLGLQIFCFQKELFSIVKQSYYYIVEGKTAGHLKKYHRHILDTLLDEAKQNKKIKHKNHSIRVIETYGKILDLKKSIDNFLQNINKYPGVANKVNMGDIEHKALLAILHYLEEQTKLFNEKFTEITQIHKEHLMSRTYNNSNPDDMEKELEELFKTIHSKNEKYFRDTGKIVTDYSVINGLNSPEHIKYNPTPTTTPSDSTPHTTRAALRILQVHNALQTPGDYLPAKVAERKRKLHF